MLKVDPYKKDLTLKYVIDNKIYSFLKNNFNDGQNFVPSIEYDDHHDELEQLSILIDSLKWSKLKLNYQRYLKSDERSKNIPISGNKWIKGKLVYKNKEYAVKIKAHGKTPAGHCVEEFFSLE